MDFKEIKSVDDLISRYKQSALEESVVKELYQFINNKDIGDPAKNTIYENLMNVLNSVQPRSGFGTPEAYKKITEENPDIAAYAIKNNMSIEEAYEKIRNQTKGTI